MTQIIKANKTFLKYTFKVKKLHFTAKIKVDSYQVLLAQLLFLAFLAKTVFFFLLNKGYLYNIPDISF